MMLYPAMNELLEQVPSRYQLVNVVAARARKIAAKAEREDLMLEIAEGHWKDPEEAAGMEKGFPEEEHLIQGEAGIE